MYFIRYVIQRALSYQRLGAKVPKLLAGAVRGADCGGDLLTLVRPEY